MFIFVCLCYSCRSVSSTTGCSQQDEPIRSGVWLWLRPPTVGRDDVTHSGNQCRCVFSEGEAKPGAEEFVCLLVCWQFSFFFSNVAHVFIQWRREVKTEFEDQTSEVSEGLLQWTTWTGDPRGPDLVTGESSFYLRRGCSSSDGPDGGLMVMVVLMLHLLLWFWFWFCWSVMSWCCCLVSWSSLMLLNMELCSLLLLFISILRQILNSIFCTTWPRCNICLFIYL